MHYLDALFPEGGGPGFRIAGGSENNLHAFFYNDLNMFVDVRVKEWYVYAERLLRGLFAFLDVFSQYIRVHASGTYEAKPSGIGNGTG
jgi:hypothetical protein